MKIRPMRDARSLTPRPMRDVRTLTPMPMRDVRSLTPNYVSGGVEDVGA